MPLFGAGISACASIPFGQHIVDYLLRVKLLSESVSWDCGDYLLAHGWPDRNQVNAQLFARYPMSSASQAQPSPLEQDLDRVRHQSREAVALESLAWLHPAARKTIEHLFDRARGAPAAREGQEQPEQQPASGGDFPELEWLPLIHHVTGRRDHLIEAFFDGLVRNRRPGNAHRFIAYLAKRVGWRLILTTNFDDLIETALREEGLSPVVYELVRGGTLPDKGLVARHLSVIKLHGGSFGLRTGFELHQELDTPSLDMFQAYVPPNALVLVVGQGGNEQRILSLMAALIDTPHGKQRNIFWVHYDRADQEAKQKADSKRLGDRMARSTYGDASLLFHELYQRLDLCHPVGREAYHAFYHLPERFLQSPAGEPRSAGSQPSREDMRQRYEQAKAEPVIRLWFNLYQFTSVAAFISVWIEELQRNDRTLPALVLSPVVAFTDLQRAHRIHRGEADANFATKLLTRAHPFCWHISRALQRQRYLIVIDAVNGFANPQSELNVGVPQEVSDEVASELRKELYEFLLCLEESIGRDGESCYQLGQSIIYLSPDAEDASPSIPHSPAPGESGFVSKDTPARSSVVFVKPAAKAKTSSFAEELHPLDSVKSQLLRVAISFRKPRSLSALVRLTTAQWKKRQPPSSGRLGPHGRDAASDEDGRDHLAMLSVQTAIQELEKDGILERQDGGLYSMSGPDRDALFRRFLDDEPKEAIELQYQIAMHYRSEVYQQSRDTAAYLEYVFHRLACIEHARLEGVESESGSDGWQRLFGSLEREHDNVLCRGHAASLLDALWCVGAKLESVKLGPGVALGPLPRKAKFELQLAKMRLEIRESVTDIEYCLAEQIRLARNLMSDLHPMTPGAEPTPTVHAAPRSKAPKAALLASFNEDFAAFQATLMPRLARASLKEVPTRERELAPRQADEAPQIQPLCDLIETVCCIADGVARLYVVRQESSVPRELVESVLELARALGRPRLIELGIDLTQRASVECRCYEARMDIMLRQHNPWKENPDADSGCWWLDPRFDTWFSTARDLLTEFGQRGHGMAERFAWLRCLKARKAYFSGRFEQAKLELNRAHAFAQRAPDSSGATIMGVYHLHRAEYCTLWARAIPIRRAASGAHEPLELAPPRALLDEALTALQEAERAFGHGRRDVFWTVRLFILRARTYAALLDSHVEECAERGVQPWIEGALGALYGAWINTHDNPQRETLLLEIREELLTLWQRSGPSGDQRWQRLNSVAGLNFVSRTPVGRRTRRQPAPATGTDS